MSLRLVQPVGLDYLAIVTRLLQDARLADPTGGDWEAADLQWWWRVDQHADPDGQAVWFDGDAPIVAAIFTRWKTSLGLDFLGTDAAVAERADLLWEHIAGRFTDRPVEMAIRDDDPDRIAGAERAGFSVTADEYRSSWMDAASRPAVPPLPDGFRIVAYDGGPHPMVARNGPAVAERLAECSIYRRQLDLSIRDGDAIAGYALFWPDPVTRVGLLEPMRIEDAYQGRGLSKALIAAGLDGLSAAGCTRFKVSFDPKNTPARRLYTGAGFQPSSIATRTWARPPAQ